MSNYWAHARYLFECLEVSRSLDAHLHKRDFIMMLSVKMQSNWAMLGISEMLNEYLRSSTA
ncbi:hypothetical protein T09_10599 [Trichinella sp. T9]|nr:hypothetical protein T09_10599 [Trichinella sp. T9]